MNGELIRSIFSISLFEGVFTFIHMVVFPVTLWILLPGLLLGIIFRRKEAYSIGAFLGLFAIITLGPL